MLGQKLMYYQYESLIYSVDVQQVLDPCTYKSSTSYSEWAYIVCNYNLFDPHNSFPN